MDLLSFSSPPNSIFCATGNSPMWLHEHEQLNHFKLILLGTSHGFKLFVTNPNL